MATAKEVPQFVKASLRSVLLSSQKGLAQTSIQKEYKKLTHSELDVKKYGYRDLYEFLLALPDVARLEYSVKDGENRVFGVAKKGVYISDHAKKAEGIPNGLKPLPPSEWPRNKAKKERTVAEDKSPLKVTEESDEKRKILPDGRGLYALHIKNFPPNCQEVSLVYENYSPRTNPTWNRIKNQFPIGRLICSLQSHCIKSHLAGMQAMCWDFQNKLTFFPS